MSKIKSRLKALLISFTCVILLVIPTGYALAEANPTLNNASVSTQRIAGTDRYETAARIAEEGWKTTSDYAVLAAGMDENLIDALTVAPLARLKSAPILLTEGNGLNSWAETELLRLKVKQVYVTSGSGVIQKSVTDRLAELGISVKSLGGLDRFETAVNIASEINSIKPVTGIILTTPWTNADALSIAPIAAARGIPILLADVNSISVSVDEYLNSIRANIQESYILGSEMVISDIVLSNVPNAERIYGEDRYGTNLEIMKFFNNELKYGKVYLANGENEHLVDALAVSPLAAQGLIPVILTSSSLAFESRSYLKSILAPKDIILLGGESVVPSGSLTGLTSAVEYAVDGSNEGSKDADAKAVIPQNLNISGNDITLENTIAAFSLNVSGNNVTLRNVDVLGTLFLDPGPNGSVNLENVTTPNIVVLSGATQSIHLKDVTSDSLRVDSPSVVRVVSDGKTAIANTYVTTPAVLDAVKGDFGMIQVAQLGDPGNVVELHGNFNQPVTLRGQAKIKAVNNATITKLEITPINKEQKITLEGSFVSVDVNREAKVELAGNTHVSKLVANVRSDVRVPPTSSIKEFDPKQTGSVPSGGGTVNAVVTNNSGNNPTKLDDDGSNLPVAKDPSDSNLTVKKITAKDILNSVSFNIAGSKPQQITLSIDEKVCSGSFNGATDTDYVNDVTINVSRNVILKTWSSKTRLTYLNMGTNTKQFYELTGEDKGTVAKIKQWGDLYGQLLDYDNPSIVLASVTFSIK